jgi:hypothetical protein
MPDALAVTTKRTAEGVTVVTETDSTLAVAALALGALAMLLAVGYDRISELTLPGGASVTLSPAWAADAVTAAHQTAAEGESPETAESLLALRVKLERKLTWMANHFVGPDGAVLGFLTPGSLNQDGYLTDEQMRTTMRILDAQTASDGSASPTLEAFLTDSGRLVANLRATATHQRAHKLLVDTYGSQFGTLDEAFWHRERRSDFLVRRPGKETLRIATVFPYVQPPPGRSSFLRATAERLAGRGPAIIVVPGRRDGATASWPRPTAGCGVEVVYLHELHDWLHTDGEAARSDG